LNNSTSVAITPGKNSPFTLILRIPYEDVQKYGFDAQQGAHARHQRRLIERLREIIISARFEAGHVDTLVATDVAARGIDVDGISHVINFDPPGDHETYVHRVGRTGRAGRRGVGITFVGRDERRDVASLARRLGLEHRLGA